MKFSELKTNQQGLIPVVTQDVKTNDVLMVAYMNEEAYEKTKETKKAYYYSRSRQQLWMKGETSGHTQKVINMRVDCDRDTLLLKVEQKGVACHTGNVSCFYQNIELESESGGNVTASKDLEVSSTEENLSASNVLEEIFQVVYDRKKNPKEGAYTTYLFEKGIDKILKKVGEEASEVIIGAKNDGNDEIIYEISDLLYHLTVLIVEKEATWQAVLKELEKRRS